MWNHAASRLLWNFDVPEVETAVRQTTDKLFALVVPTHRPQAYTLMKTFNVKLRCVGNYTVSNTGRVSGGGAGGLGALPKDKINK